ncbi:MAG: 50S ribosome-binding GTPase [Synergistaceae bacterium]|nr:50S ribosome-binding GTPase [Synergistaceae bacterium]
MLSKKDAETLERFTHSGLLEKWEGLRKKFDSGGKITIANTGQYSSGKSTLFNALLGRTDNERFQTGAVPTTKKGDRERFTEGIDLMDTPGFDANLADDAEAFRMLMQADIIIMTHNVKTGMLNRPEYEWLKRIADGIGQENLSDRLIFVSTWIDEIQDESDRKKIRDELQRQISEISRGKSIAFYEVSAKRYYTAMKKGNANLERASRIPELREGLTGRAKLYGESLQTLRKKELAILCYESRNALNSLRFDKGSEISRRKTRIRERHSSAFETWRGIKGRFESMRQNVFSKLHDIRQYFDSSSDYQSYQQRVYEI